MIKKLLGIILSMTPEIREDVRGMKGFCERCRDEVEYHVKTTNKEKESKGIKIKYIGKVAYCDECNEEIFVPDVRDYNLKMLNDAYKEINNIDNEELRYQ